MVKSVHLEPPMAAYGPKSGRCYVLAPSNEFPQDTGYEIDAGRADSGIEGQGSHSGANWIHWSPNKGKDETFMAIQGVRPILHPKWLK